MLAAIPFQLLGIHHKSFLGPFVKCTLMVHGFFADAHHAFNDVGWTLGCEAFFYAMFPLLARMFYTPKIVSRIVWVYLGFFLYGAAMLYLNQSTSPADSFPVNTMSLAFPPNRLAEFVTGMVGGYVFTTQRVWLDSMVLGLKIRKSAALIGALSFFILALLLTPRFVMLFGQSPGFPLQNICYLLYMMLAIGLIITLASFEKAGIVLKGLNAKLPVLAGEISYSFYLVHNLVIKYIAYGTRMLLKFNLLHLPMLAKVPLTLSIFAVDMGLACFLFFMVEKPSRHIIKNWFASKQLATVSTILMPKSQIRGKTGS
jgi:peptidoglycan/LPS O-acetylase OafA/YrhL